MITVLDEKKRRMKGTTNFYTFAFLRQATRNAFEAAQSAKEGSDHHRVAAVLFSALTIEAHLNHVGESKILDWDEVERELRFVDKFDRIAKEIGVPLDRSCRPIQTVIEIFKFRDKLVHGKTHMAQFEYEYVEGNRESEDLKFYPSWLKKYLTDDGVKRVMDDVNEVLENFHAAAGLEKYTLYQISDGDFAEQET